MTFTSYQFFIKLNRQQMAKEKADKARGASLNEIFIKDQVLSMRGNKVVRRRPRKKGEGKDNSNTLKNLWNK